MLRRLWFFVTRWRRVQELDEEMRLHVDLRAAANRRHGVHAEAAARQARVRFGNPLKLREEALDVWGFAEMERIGGDLRQAVRRIAQRPTQTLVVVLTLGLGIGATTAMFTLLDAMLLRPAPWNRGDRVVWIMGMWGQSTAPRRLSYPDYLVYRDRTTTFSGVAAEGGTAMAVGGQPPQRVLGALVSGNYFDVLGLHAQLGRTFAPDEDRAPGASPVVVLSDALWTSHFGGDPGVIGRSVAINGHPFTIIGVTPVGFTGSAFATDPYQLWMPTVMLGVVRPTDADVLTDPNRAWFLTVGRLRDGVTLSEADAEVRTVARQVNAPDAPADKARGARVLPMRGGLTPWEQESLTPMFGLVSIVPALVLLVACANAANVLMAYHTARRREFAMRRAIGASRGRLVRQLLAESLVVALLAGLAGFGGSFVLSTIIVHFGEIPPDFSALLALDSRALFAATAVGVGTVVLFGLAPVLTTTRAVDVVPSSLSTGSTSSTHEAAVRARLRQAFRAVGCL